MSRVPSRALSLVGGSLAALAMIVPGAASAGAQALPQPAAPCQFVLGFGTLRDLVGGGKVGDCLENQRFVPNGNAEQLTGGGLLVWRKADNWTAFTDGSRTWINGPYGLAERPNTELFSWEPRTSELPPPAEPAPAPGPQPSGPVNGRAANWAGQDRRGAFLPGADLYQLKARGADFTGADLTGANLVGADLSSANLTGANLTGADLSRANLTGANLTGANLTSADLRTAVGSKAIFFKATLFRAKLHGANLTSADLREGDRREADFSQANLTSADLRLADLKASDLSQANLSRANFTGANLTGATHTGANWTAAITGGCTGCA